MRASLDACSIFDVRDSISERTNKKFDHKIKRKIDKASGKYFIIL